MSSNTEQLLRAILNDSEAPDVEIISRVDKYLKACCEKCGCEDLPTPISRIDYLLYDLADKMSAKYGTVQTADASKMILPTGKDNFILQVKGEEHQQNFICTALKLPNACAIVFDFGNSYCGATPEQVNLIYNKETGEVSFATQDMTFKVNTDYAYAVW